MEAPKVLEKFLGYPFPIVFVLKTEVLEAKTPKGKWMGLFGSLRRRCNMTP
jgi:hypothetical protein